MKGGSYIKIFVLTCGEYETYHIEKTSFNPDYIIEKAIEVQRKNDVFNEFMEIEIWENEERICCYGNNINDLINKISSLYTDEEIKREFFNRLKEVDK